MFRTISEITSDFRTFADSQEKLDIYDCRNLATDSLRAYADFLDENENISGNIHELQEALSIVGEMVHDSFWKDNKPTLNLAHDVNKVVKEALNKPKRNCDRFDCYGDALRAFEEEADDSMDIGEWLMMKVTVEN